MFRNKSVNVHQFAMVPRGEIPRSSFNMQKTYKTTFDAGYLVPVFCEEILPGDTFKCRMTAFCRLATPLFPVMDNLYLESFFFFIPKRLLWTNWVKFMGEQANPGDSISYIIPTVTSPVGGYAVGSLQDYLGLPTVGQVGGGATVTHNTLPLRAYQLCFHEWFRDENLEAGLLPPVNDGPDNPANFTLVRRGKRHDYFTGCLPNPQKGGTAVTVPLGTLAPVKTALAPLVTGAQTAASWLRSDGSNPVQAQAHGFSAGFPNQMVAKTTALGADNGSAIYPSNLYADLSVATAATINQLRQSFQIQKLLERDARGGTRYVEILLAHFGVRSPDFRLQRPEYLGGGMTAISINPIAQTGQTGLTGGTTPLGTLGAMGTALASGHGFSQSFTEHGYVLGMVNVRADLTYQQGLRKMWSRSTRYDFYFPAFAMLGEQAVLNREIYCDGSATDANVFGYQERWAEYRYLPSQITGKFRSTSAGTLDPWHFAQRFVGVPVLNSTFIRETPPLSRVLAVGAGADGAQLLLDAFFDVVAARPMPLYSVPGLIDHF